MSKVYGRYVNTGTSLQTLTQRGTNNNELRVWVNYSKALGVITNRGLGVKILKDYSGLTITPTGKLAINYTQAGALHVNSTGVFDIKVQTAKVTVSSPAAEAGAMIIYTASSGRIAWMYNPSKGLTVNACGVAEINFQTIAAPTSITAHIGALTITPADALGVAYSPQFGLTLNPDGVLALKLKPGGGLTFNQDGQLSNIGDIVAGDTWTVVNGTFPGGALTSITVNNTIVQPSYTLLRIQGLGSQMYTTDYTASGKKVSIVAALAALLTAGDGYSVMHRI